MKPPLYLISIFSVAIHSIGLGAPERSIVRDRIEVGAVDLIDFPALPLEEVRIAIDAVRTETDKLRQERAIQLLCRLVEVKPLPEAESKSAQSALLEVINDPKRRMRTLAIAVYAKVYKVEAGDDLLPLLDDPDEGVRIEAVESLGEFAPASFASTLERKLNARARALGTKQAEKDGTIKHGRHALEELRIRDVGNIDLKTLPLEKVQSAIDALKTETDVQKQRKADYLLCLIAQSTPLPEAESKRVRSALLEVALDKTRKKRELAVRTYATKYKEDAGEDLLPLLDDSDQLLRIQTVQLMGAFAPPSFADTLEKKLDERAKALRAEGFTSDAADADPTIKFGREAAAAIRKRAK
jgi:HEAT repeats